MSSFLNSARNSNGTYITNTSNCNTKTASFANSKPSIVQNNKTPSVVNSGTKILKLKRTSDVLQPERGSSTRNGSNEPVAKKRDKITWP